MKLLLSLLITFGGISVAFAETTKISITSFLEIALPAEDLQASKAFYQKMGYEVIEEQPWGMVTLKRNDSRLTLLSKSFFKSIAIAYTTSDLEKTMKELNQAGIKVIEDDSKSEPARITIADPTGNEVTIYQQ